MRDLWAEINYILNIVVTGRTSTVVVKKVNFKSMNIWIYDFRIQLIFTICILKEGIKYCNCHSILGIFECIVRIWQLNWYRYRRNQWVPLLIFRIFDPKPHNILSFVSLLSLRNWFGWWVIDSLNDWVLVFLYEGVTDSLCNWVVEILNDWVTNSLYNKYCNWFHCSWVIDSLNDWAIVSMYNGVTESLYNGVVDSVFDE